MKKKFLIITLAFSLFSLLANSEKNIYLTLNKKSKEIFLTGTNKKISDNIKLLDESGNFLIKNQYNSSDERQYVCISMGGYCGEDGDYHEDYACFWSP